MPIHKRYKQTNVLYKVRFLPIPTDFVLGSDSARQVQDLERQLQELRLQLDRYRASEPNAEQDSPSASASGSVETLPDIADISRSPRRMLKARPPYDLSTTRAQLSDVGRGLLKPLITPLTQSDFGHDSQHSVSLPTQESAQRCLNAYFECVHRRLPIFYWPEFCSTFWSLYSRTSDQGLCKETKSLCFAVLALGALSSVELEVRNAADHYVAAAISLSDLFNERLGVDVTLASFLVSMYFAELNQKTTSWIWLGSAIQMAQDKGLHISGGQWSRTDGELRRRIWYCLYVSERYGTSTTNDK